MSDFAEHLVIFAVCFAIGAGFRRWTDRRK
jgi:hypothetical protein